MKLLLIVLSVGSFLLHQGASGADTVRVSVVQGDSVTLNTGVQTNQQEKIKWYYNVTVIAQINGDQSKICTDVQCNNDTERFRDRLKLDNQTGSLTILNITNTDSGDYELQISHNVKIFKVFVHDVSVMEGDSVTLYTGVQTNQQDNITWDYDNTCIAEITGNQSKICTDVQCNEGTERFRDRLKLDHQTGSLTIMNITNTHAGYYELQINHDEKIFKVFVHGAKREPVKKKEGESVTLDSGVINNASDVRMWYFNEILIAEFTGDQNKTCTDVQCKKKFGDRLNLDPQTGSLNITNTTTEDSGEYRLSKHISISISISGRRRRSISSSSGSISNAKRFDVTVTGSGLSNGAIAGIVLGLLGCAAAVGLIYYRHRGSRKVLKEHIASDERIMNEEE